MMKRARELLSRLMARTVKRKTELELTTSDNELTCRDIVELVTDYLEQALLPQTRVQFEEHIAACEGCTNYVEQVRKTIDMLHRLAAEPVLPATKQELLEVFRNLKQG
jgi:predicted anti-sigma-YlaC factor YlaD